MTTHRGSGGVERACMDRCEVCQRVIVQRPDPARRRCADHLAQLELVPEPHPSKGRTRSTSTTRSTTSKPRRPAGGNEQGGSR